MKRVIITALGLSGLLFAAGLPAQLDSLRQLSNARPVPLAIDQAFHYYVTEIDSNHLRLTWELAPEHYLYHHAFHFSLDPAPAGTNTGVRFDLPEGLHKTDQFFGEVEVYYNRVSIELEIPPSRGATDLLIEFQGCADWGFCYPPQLDRVALTPATTN